MPLVFGFDIGTTSIGFAAIELDPDNSAGAIRRLGVRIFPEARDPDGKPLNQTRRDKRQLRRQIRRRRSRRRLLNIVLTEAGLLPAYSSRDWPKVMALDPYLLRERALTEALAPYELGRALYHLAKRRHFQGRDLEDNDESEEETAEDAAARNDRESTLRALKAEGVTLGQWLARKPPSERRRGIHAARSVVREEFEKLLSAQAGAHPQLRDATFQQQITEAIFFQRPVFWRLNTLGTCPLEPGAELAPRGSWISQQRRMLEKLNNLAIAGGNARPLDPDERAAIHSVLETRASMTWPQVRRVLQPIFQSRGESTRYIKFNLEIGGEKRLLGNAIEANLADIFGDAWPGHSHKQTIRDAAHERIWSADYGRIGQRVVIRSAPQRALRRRDAAQSFIADFGVSQEQAAALAAMTFPAGWDVYSTHALKKILPRLEEGQRFGALIVGPDWQDWRRETFPNRVQPTGEILDRLPSPADKDEQRRLGALRNPTVVRVQNELRKVANNLIDFCGRKPDLVRIELAREVGMSKRQREDLSAARDKQERRRKTAKTDLETNGIKEPSREDIERWILWEECGRFDPYSGLPIAFDDLFRTGEFEVEHIWPRSTSLDNSFANKTLCRRDWNQRKAKRTPYDAFHMTPEWEAMKERMWKRVNQRAMAKRKAVRFCWDKPLPEDFVERQLNDTGWAARAAISQLKRLWPDVGPTAPVTVQAVSGRVTGHLRRLWGLNNILSVDGKKTRADHRHHAIDALVIACASPSMTHKLSRYWQAYDNPRRTERSLQLDPPWPTIRQDADVAASRIVVSHRARKKVSGQLHMETIYGDTKSDFQSKTGTYHQFVTRKPVASLSKSLLAADPSNTGEGIVDGEVRKVLQQWVERNGGDPKKAFPPYPRLGQDGPEIRKVRVLSKQKMDLMAKTSTGYADPTISNHHIVIWRKPDGKADYQVVTLFDAAQRLARRSPVVHRARDGMEFAMSLAPGETIHIPTGDRKGYWVVSGVWANGQIILQRLSDAVSATTFRPTAGSILTAGARKVALDPIGRVRPAGD